MGHPPTGPYGLRYVVNMSTVTNIQFFQMPVINPATHEPFDTIGPRRPASRRNLQGRCLVDAINANNNMGVYNHTQSSAGDSTTPLGASQYAEMYDEHGTYRGSQPLNDAGPRDMMLLPPMYYVDADTKRCVAAGG